MITNNWERRKRVNQIEGCQEAGENDEVVYYEVTEINVIYALKMKVPIFILKGGVHVLAVS